MSQQWQPQGQPNFQYAQQTGMPRQQGFPGQIPQQQFLQGQPTGYPGGLIPQQQQQPNFLGQGPGFVQAQPTGYPGAGGPQFQQQQGGFQRALSPGFQQPTGNPSLFNPGQQGLQPPGAQQQRFLSPSPSLGGPGLSAQPTGWAQPQIGQPTGIGGYNNPQLQMMSSTLMPSSLPVPTALPQYAGGNFQQQQGISLQQSFQQQNQQQHGTAAPAMSWELSRDEKKNYDQIFRAWDQRSTGFISGDVAKEVFSQAGLDRDDLARVWTLADADNRGKLNLAEFHVAMGLIYRRLSGMPIPDQLPSELVPVSSRSLGDSVDFLKDILKNDTNLRATSGVGSPLGSSTPVSYAKTRSFRDSNGPDAGTRKDGTVYKHDDTDVRGYRSTARHIDRRDVRARNDDASDDISTLKRQLDNTDSILQQGREADSSRTAEDVALDEEMDDLTYRVKRLQEDLERLGRGAPSVRKDEERRKFERELLYLRHEKVPEVERKIEDRDRRKQSEKEDWARDRDRRNDRYGGKYDDGDRYGSRDNDPRDRDGGRRRDEEEDRGYLRGTFDKDNKDRDYGRDRDGRSSPYSRGNERDRDGDRDRRDPRDRPRSPPKARSPPPPAPATLTVARPAPSASPAPNLKGMSADERAAYIRQQAQERLQARMKALGVSGPSNPSTPAVDSSVEDRLAQDRKEAEEKAKQAEKEAEERERVRKQRVEDAKAARDPPPTVPTRAAAPVPPPTAKRPPAPPPPPSAIRQQPPPPPTATTPRLKPAAPKFDDDGEEEELRKREEALRKRAERRAELERQEEEARQQEIEFQKRREAAKAKPVGGSRGAPPPPPIRNRQPPPPVTRAAPVVQPPPVVAPPPREPTPPPPVVVALAREPSPPPPPPPPPPPVVTSPAVANKTNPFHKLTQNGATSGTPSAVSTPSTSNPFFKMPGPTATSSVAPPAPQPPKSSATPVGGPRAYNTAPADESDWEDIREKDDDSDSSDDGGIGNRAQRQTIAASLFGSILPRPASTGPVNPARPASTGPKSAPPETAPRPPVVAQSYEASADDLAAPPPPPPPPFTAPPPPPPPPVTTSAPTSSPAPPGGMGALLGAIQGGARLRKTVTNDRSVIAGGTVLGDTAPPAHILNAPRALSPPPATFASPATEVPSVSFGQAEPQTGSKADHRQSVDWYAGLAAEGMMPRASAPHSQLASYAEEEEELPANIPGIHVEEPSESSAAADPLADIDRSVEIYARTQYSWEGQGPDDLSFGENLTIRAHPSKSGADWWYGTLVSNGAKGLFPRDYVLQVEEGLRAKATYPYETPNPDELSFAEGDVLSILDRSEQDWWKTEKDGVVLSVPASYLEVVDDAAAAAAAAAPAQVMDSLASPTQTSRDPRIGTANSSRRESVNLDHSESDSDEYTSFDSDSEAPEDAEPSTPLSNLDQQAEDEAREKERQRVFEAAGLVVKVDQTHRLAPPPPLPVRRQKSTRNRRKAPERPARQIQIPQVERERDLPEIPTSPVESVTQVDDAFERYESFKKAGNRMSMASLESGPASPAKASGSGSGDVTPSVSKDGESPVVGRTHGLFNFLGRGVPDRRPSPGISTSTISAPVMSAARNSEPWTETSASFGTSWSSLVDKAALEGLDSKERKRQEAIFELIFTEGAFVRDLQLIVETFYASMLPMLDETDTNAIFSNIEDILLANTAFLSALEDRQRDCRLYIDAIGDLLAQYMPNMGVYMQYCVNQGPAIKVLQALRSARPELNLHLQRLREDPSVRNLDLSSYLLIPMQRITRYPLLVRQIINYTADSGECQLLETAVSSAQGILEAINETIRDREGHERLTEISKDLWLGQGHLDLTEPTRYMGRRKLVREGPLSKAKSGRKLHAILCNDILVLMDVSAHSLYHMPIPLNELKVENSPRDDLAFQISLPYPRGGETIHLRAISARDCHKWIGILEETSNASVAAQKVATRRRSGRGSR